MFKLRIYHTQGVNKGNLHHEEYFTSIDEMAIRYREICKMVKSEFRPTAWRLTDDGCENLMSNRGDCLYFIKTLKEVL